MKNSTVITVVLLTLFVAISSHAIDEIRFEKGQSASDVRMAHKLEILHTAMDKTIPDYGPYTISADVTLNTLRAQLAIQEGKTINVYIALTDNIWEKIAIPIRIPIRRGILNYRLLLVHRDDLPLFREVQTIEDLKRLKAGLLHFWTTTKIMQQTGFNIITASNYDGLFKMLDSHRFNYLPRGINEIFAEFEQYKPTLKNIAIEPDLLLVIPTPSYIFVSPQYPRLAQRLKKGLEIMIHDGTFEAIFNKYFAANIKRANLHNRRILRLTNPLLPQETPLNRSELWFDPLKEK